MEDDTHSFIIRIWGTDRAQTKELKGTWRGSIDYVGSGRRLYFSDLESIATFIQEQIYSDASQSVAHWEDLVERARFGRRFRSFWRRLIMQGLKRFRHRKTAGVQENTS